MVKQLHFIIGNPSSIVGMCRQAYWYENRQKWALDTLFSLGVPDKATSSKILSGHANLAYIDGIHVEYVEKDEHGYIQELKEHSEWVAANTYTFAGRTVSKSTVDTYVNNIVGRLRNALKSGSLQFMDVNYVSSLEKSRVNIHREIIVEAGFNREEAEEHKNLDYQHSPEYEAFNSEFQAYVDQHTLWGSYDNEFK